MSFLKRFQNVILAAALIAVAFVAYSYFFTGSSKAPLTVQEVSKTSAVDQDLISLLLELKAINLDESIFQDAAFRSLSDFSKELVPEPIGRTNPFAPLNAPATTPPKK